MEYYHWLTFLPPNILSLSFLYFYCLLFLPPYFYRRLSFLHINPGSDLVYPAKITLLTFNLQKTIDPQKPRFLPRVRSSPTISIITRVAAMHTPIGAMAAMRLATSLAVCRLDGARYKSGHGRYRKIPFLDI